MFLGDGAHWLWELAALQFPEARPILNRFPLEENIHKAANAVFGEGSDAALRLRAAQYDGEFDPFWEARLHRAA